MCIYIYTCECICTYIYAYMWMSYVYWIVLISWQQGCCRIELFSWIGNAIHVYFLKRTRRTGLYRFQSKIYDIDHEHDYQSWYVMICHDSMAHGQHRREANNPSGPSDLALEDGGLRLKDPIAAAKSCIRFCNAFNQAVLDTWIRFSFAISQPQWRCRKVFPGWKRCGFPCIFQVSNLYLIFLGWYIHFCTVNFRFMMNNYEAIDHTFTWDRIPSGKPTKTMGNHNFLRVNQV